VICAPDWEVSTVEHLLAACTGAGLTDARVVVDGPELPALDGSARDWLALFEGVGLTHGPTISLRSPPESLCVHIGDGVAHWRPSKGAIAEVREGQRSFRVQLWSPDTRAQFEREVCWARTFVRRDDIARLRAAGRGRGATWANTVFLDDTSSSMMRGEGEPLRHKLLDLVGDLTLMGEPWSGHVIVERGSHALHHALVRECMALLDSTPRDAL